MMREATYTTLEPPGAVHPLASGYLPSSHPSSYYDQAAHPVTDWTDFYSRSYSSDKRLPVSCSSNFYPSAPQSAPAPLSHFSPEAITSAQTQHHSSGVGQVPTNNNYASALDGFSQFNAYLKETAAYAANTQTPFSQFHSTATSSPFGYTTDRFHSSPAVPQEGTPPLTTSLLTHPHYRPPRSVGISSRVPDLSPSRTSPLSLSDSNSASSPDTSSSSESVVPQAIANPHPSSGCPSFVQPSDEESHSRYTWCEPRKRGSTKEAKTRTPDTYRQVYTDEQRLELEKEYHSGNYITTKRKTMLCHTLNLSERQIKIWFQNRRAKQRRIQKRIEATGVKCPDIKNEVI